MSKARALVCLSQAFHIRNIIYSKFFEQLRAGYDVTLVMPEGFTAPQELAPLLEGCDLRSVAIEPVRFEAKYGFLRKNVFAGRERTQTFNLITEGDRAKRPYLHATANALNSVFGRIPAAARMWRRFEGWAIPGTEFDAILNAHPFDVVITSNYGTEPMESRLIRAARRAGVPSIAIVPSWDNLTSKGVIGAMPDHLSVWNETMLDEALKLYDFTPEQVHVTGALQFDHHLAAARAEPGPVPQAIPPGAPLLLYATITPKYFRFNIEVVEVALEQIAKGALPTDTHVVIRLHPQVLYDPVYGDDLSAYSRLEEQNENVHLSVPKIVECGSLKAPAPSDFNELIALLRRADAVLAPASTVALDAAAVDSPMIGLGFDGKQSLPPEQSVRRTFDFTHYRSLMRHGAVEIAETPAELAEIFAAYFQRPSIKAQERRAVVEALLTYSEGDAHKRVFDLIAQVRAQ